MGFGSPGVAPARPTGLSPCAGLSTSPLAVPRSRCVGSCLEAVGTSVRQALGGAATIWACVQKASLI